LAGSIPGEIGSLESLRLNNNSMKGTIPENI